MKNNNGFAVLFRSAYALPAWFAVILQFILMMQNKTATAGETIIRFFSFFTILTNILAAVCFTCLLIRSSSFFARPRVLTATTVYMIVVGLTYNIILRSLWSPQGWAIAADELLHAVLPALLLIYWLLFVPKKDLRWKDILPGVIYPAVYCILVLTRAAYSGWYPYPFLDAAALGYPKLFINIAGMIGLFLIVYILVTLTARILTNRAARIFLHHKTTK